MRRLYLLCLAILLLPCLSMAASDKPNIIVIFADDLGYGDLSSYGSTSIHTPNLDELAEGGIRFTEFYSASQVCSPSRAALLTGRYPVRSGVNMVYFHDSMEGLPQSEITIAELLKKNGYATGMVGKWHLGHLDRFMPWNQGFDEFYGVPYSNDMKNFYLYDNREIIYEPVDQRFLTQNYTERALQFLERHQGEPFFLYLAHSMPHVPLYASLDFEGKSEAGIYGDVVEELDWSTGEIVKRLEQLNLLENTLIVFSSDNGPWLAMRDHGGSPGPLRQGKTTPFDGGYKVPTIAYWKNSIPAHQANDTIANMMDWFPTFAELSGAELPTDRIIDGRSLAGEMLGTGQRESTPFFYYHMRIPVLTSIEGEVAGVRDGKWKLKLAYDGLYPEFLDFFIKVGLFRHGTLLFDLENDPGEQNNLASKHPEEVERLRQLIFEFEGNLEAGHATLGSATENDARDYLKLAYGVAMALLFILFCLSAAMALIVKGVKHFRR